MSVALIAVAAVVVILVLLLALSVRVAREYERGVIFRLGRLHSPPKGPGLFLLIPIIDKMVRVDLRTVTLNIPPQEVITKDNVPVRVNAVAYFRIIDPERAIVQVENYMVATSQIAQTTLRSVLGQHVLDELLSERDKINTILQEIIDEATSPWGIKVSIVEVKDVEIPTGMQRAMARQAEAERERRAKVIASEGEFQASERLKDAANVMATNPIALQLRLPADDPRDELRARDDHGPPATDRSAGALPGQGRGRHGLTEGHSPPELRRDPLSGRWVVVAPSRARRPGAPHAQPVKEHGRPGGLPVRRGSRVGHPARDLRHRAPWSAARHARLARARRSEQVPRLWAVVARRRPSGRPLRTPCGGRTPGGRRSLTAPCALARRLDRAGARACRRSVAGSRGGSPRGRVPLPARACERGRRSRGKPRPQPLAARLARAGAPARRTGARSAGQPTKAACSVGSSSRRGGSGFASSRSATG